MINLNYTKSFYRINNLFVLNGEYSFIRMWYVITYVQFILKLFSWSRLENKVGLNIADNHYVILKLKEKEEKQTHSRKRHLPKDKTPGNKCRKTAAKSEKSNKENKTFNDPEIAAAIQNLQAAVDATETTLDSDMSHEELDSVL